MNAPCPKMTSDQAQTIEAWQRVERLEAILQDVEGSLLAYWTDIPQEEVRRLLTLIGNVTWGAKA